MQQKNAEGFVADQTKQLVYKAKAFTQIWSAKNGAFLLNFCRRPTTGPLKTVSWNKNARILRLFEKTNRWSIEKVSSDRNRHLPVMGSL